MKQTSNQNGSQVKLQNFPSLLVNRNPLHVSQTSNSLIDSQNRNQVHVKSFKAVKRMVTITPQDILEQPQQCDPNKQILLKDFLSRGLKHNQSMQDDFNRHNESLFDVCDEREVSPESSRLMTVRKEDDPNQQRYLKRSIVGQVKEYVDVQQERKRKESLRFRSIETLRRSNSPGSPMQYPEQSKIRPKIAKALVMKLQPITTRENPYFSSIQGAGKYKRAQFDRNLMMPEDQSISQLQSIDIDTQRLLNRKSQVQLRHQQSKQFWDQTVKKIQDRIKQSKSLIQRQTEYKTNSTWAKNSEVDQVQASHQLDYGSRIRDYFASFRDMNYCYASTDSNPYNQLFCIHRTKGLPMLNGQMKTESNFKQFNTSSSMQSFRKSQKQGDFDSGYFINNQSQMSINNATQLKSYRSGKSVEK